MEMQWITVDQVKAKVNTVKILSADPEAAHSAEDRLHQKVLSEISLGHPNPQEIALAAIQTCDIDFPRWCA